MKKILTFIQIILLIVAIIALVSVIQWFIQNNQTDEIVKDISKSVTIVKTQDENGEKDEYNIDFKELKSKNSDTIAYLKVNGTNIEYPVVKTDNNDFYLTHNFEKNDSSAGWIFADFENNVDGNDKNLVIYGHNRHNDSMFGTLKNILTPEWCENEENRNVLLITENGNCIYQVFSVYQIEKENYYITTHFENDEDFAKYIETIKNRSIYDFNIEISENDNILTLSTCANNNKYRIVLHAKRVN